MSQQPNAPDNSNPSNVPNMGQAQQMAGQSQMQGMNPMMNAGQGANSNAVMDQKNAMGLGLGMQQNASPEQLQAMAQLQQQQQAQMSNYLQQIQQMQALQQFQQQNLANSLQSMPAGLNLTGGNESQLQAQLGQTQQQLQAQNLLQQQQLQQQQLLQQAALLQHYNPLMAMSAPQQLLPQGFGIPPGSLNPQQMQGLMPQQFGQTTPQLTINGIAPNQFGPQRQGPSDQQNILNINITPQHMGTSAQRNQDDKPRKDYMMMEDNQAKQKDVEAVDDIRHRSPIELKKDSMNRDLSAPKSSMHPKLNAISFNEKSQQRKAQSKVRPELEVEKKDSSSQQRKKSKPRKTFVQNNLAKETAASQRKLGGKISVRQQIKKQIYHLGKLEEAIKDKQRRQASQSRSPPRDDQNNVAVMPQDMTGAGPQAAALPQQQLPTMEQLQQQQQMIYNQYMGQQPSAGYPNMLNQQAFLPYAQPQQPVDQGIRRFTFEANKAQVQQEHAKHPSIEQMQTPQLNTEALEPRVSEPSQPQAQPTHVPDRGSRRSLTSDINQRALGAGDTLGKEQIGQTEIFDNQLVQEVPSADPKNADNQDLNAVATQRKSEGKAATPRSQREKKTTAAEQKALSNRLSQPNERVSHEKEEVPQPAAQRKSEPRAPTPPRSQEKGTPRKGQSSSRKSGRKAGVNVIQTEVPLPTVDQAIDQQAIDKLVQEEADLEAEMQQDEMERMMNQQEVDDLINQEEEFMNTKAAAEMQALAASKDPLTEAEELFQQEAQQLKSQASKTSLNKRKIKVSDQQKEMLKSAKSFWSESKSKKPSAEAPSQTLDQMMLEVGAAEVAPEVPLPPKPEAPETSLTQLELELENAVEPDVPVAEPKPTGQSVKGVSQKAPSVSVHHQRGPSHLTAQQMNFSQMELELEEPNNKSEIIAQKESSQNVASAAKSVAAPRQQSSKAASSQPRMSQHTQKKSGQKELVPSQQASQKDALSATHKSQQSQKQPLAEAEIVPKPPVIPEVPEAVPEEEEVLQSENKAQDLPQEPIMLTQDDEPPATEHIVNLADAQCLPQFETIVKTKQELIAMEVDSDSEKEDTDGYLSEEIDIKKSQIGIFNSSHLQPQKQDMDKAEGRVSKDRSSAKESEKSEKIKQMKEKEKKKQEEDKGSDKSNDPPDKKPNEPFLREPYESLSHEQIKQTMYLSQRGLLYQVRGLQQKKGHKFLIKNSKNHLYEYLQEYREIVQIDKDGIFEINHPKKIYFEIFVIILAIYNCFGIPLEICFQPVTMEATEFVVLNSVIDFIFGVDIYVQFKTTFYDPLSGDEVFDKKVIFWTYLKGRFIVDFMATVPFDNITYAITRQRISILPLFSLLKLIRITRLGRIIERMNVREHIKLMMKLSQIIFMLIMFIHCQACAWFYIVSLTKDWTAPLDGIDPNNDLYNDTTVRKYLISVYYSILLLTCNDITPKGQWKIFFCAASVTLGAIINSIIFGNMALIIQNLNQKNSEFQESIDLANTAMKNMDMPKELQQDVVSYLQYTQQSQNGQQEFEYFYGCLSPSLRNEVIQLIFKEVTYKCELFDKNAALIDFFIKSLQLMLLDPEYPLVNQGEKDNRFFFIKAGECEVYVKDPITKRDTLVRTLKGGNFFGEVSLLTGQPRTASVRPKIYAMIGYFHEQKFEEMVFMFPEVRSALQKHFFTYNDINRQWQREQLKNIQFMLYLPEDILDELTISLSLDIYDENQEIFKQGQVSDKVYILSRGKIEIFLTIPEGELFLDCITEPGSVLSQISILNRMKLTYSARAREDSEMLSISYEKLQEQRALNHMQRLNHEIEKYFEKTITPLDLGDKRALIGFLDYQKKRPKGQKKLTGAVRQQILREVINRQVMICRFQYKKDNILSDLIAELKKMNMDDQQKSLNKMKELVKSIAPIIVSKLKKLVSNRIKQVHQESLKQNQSIKNIHSIIQLINDQHKQKTQSLPASDKKTKGSKKGSTPDEDMQKSDKSPNQKYGVKQSLQNIEEQEEENKSSEESVDLSQVEDDY